jgi:hypothetical protein
VTERSREGRRSNEIHEVYCVERSLNWLKVAEGTEPHAVSEHPQVTASAVYASRAKTPGLLDKLESLDARRQARAELSAGLVIVPTPQLAARRWCKATARI